MSKMNTTLNGALLTRAVALLLIICLAECAAGSCLSYGHSCWGAHGKRSSARDASGPPSRGVGPLGDRLFLARLLQRPEQRRAALPALAFALNQQALDGGEGALWQHRRALRNSYDNSDDRMDYNIGKLITSETEDQPSDEQNAADFMFMDNAIPRPSKINLMQMLKENSAGNQ